MLNTLKTCSIWANCRRSLITRTILVKNKYSSKSNAAITFQNFITQRREQAAKSIVVQVQSANSFDDLYSYCSQFGDIVVAQHYEIKEDTSNFILVEFEKVSSTEEALGSASFNLNASGIPTHSPLVWFKAVSAKDEKVIKISLNETSKLVKLRYSSNITDENDLLKHILSCENISNQINLLYDLTKLSDMEIRLKFLAARQIEKAVSGMFPNACASLFGSSINGFGKIGCDLDLDLLFNESTTENRNSRFVFHAKENMTNERSQTQKQMESISDILQIFLPGITNVRRILQARVPIIKFHHMILNLDVDLTMNNFSGVYMSELLYIFGEMDSRVRPLIFTIRKWAQSVGLTNPSPGRWITNFSLSCLVIFFLQQLEKPILPATDSLKLSLKTHNVGVTSEMIGSKFSQKTCGSLSRFNTNNEDSLNKLLLQFFEYYSQFDFSNKALSLNKAKILPKPDHSAVYIVNPLEQHFNISKNISLEECERLRIEVRNAAWILENEEINKNSHENVWGIAALFKNYQKNVIKPNIYFKPRMVEIKTLFDEKSVKEEPGSKLLSSKIKLNSKILDVELEESFEINKQNES